MLNVVRLVLRTTFVPYPSWVCPPKGSRWDDVITVVALVAGAIIVIVMWRKYRIPDS